MSEIGSDVLNAGGLDGLHGDRMTENAGVDCAPDAGGRRVASGPGARSGP